MKLVKGSASKKNDMATWRGDAGIDTAGIFNEPGYDEDELLNEPLLDIGDSEATASS